MKPNIINLGRDKTTKIVFYSGLRDKAVLSQPNMINHPTYSGAPADDPLKVP